MKTMNSDPSLIDEMLRTAKTIAVVGMSDKTRRASHNIGRYMAANGYRVFTAHPSPPSLDSPPVSARQQTGSGIDLVDVFRSSEHVPPIVDDVIRLHIPY